VRDDEGQDLMTAFMRYHKSVLDDGIMVDSNVLDSFEHATSVQVGRAGERIVTDGPFAETHEYLGGYYLLDLPDLDTAIDWAARCPGARHGRIEVRPVQYLDMARGARPWTGCAGTRRTRRDWRSRRSRHAHSPQWRPNRRPTTCRTSDCACSSPAATPHCRSRPTRR
jgi:hypothetical protein